MPAFGPVSHREFVAALRLPNPHRGDIGVNLLGRILVQVGISRQDWEGE